MHILITDFGSAKQVCEKLTVLLRAGTQIIMTLAINFLISFTCSIDRSKHEQIDNNDAEEELVIIEKKIVRKEVVVMKKTLVKSIKINQ